MSTAKSTEKEKIMGYAGDAMNELHGTDVFTEESRLSGIAPDLRAEMEAELSERTQTRRKISVLDEVAGELCKAKETHAPMNGHHEGYAVILEELDELWEVCKRNTHKFGSEAAVRVEQRKFKREAMRKEALQVAAMAVRFIEDVCDKESP